MLIFSCLNVQVGKDSRGFDMDFNKNLVIETLKNVKGSSKNIIPSFSLNDVNISFGMSKTIARHRKLQFESFHGNQKISEYEHLEKFDDPSISNVRLEYWLAAHEITHLVCYELEEQPGFFCSDLCEANADEQGEWEFIHQELLDSARYWYHKWGRIFSQNLL